MTSCHYYGSHTSKIAAARSVDIREKKAVGGDVISYSSRTADVRILRFKIGSSLREDIPFSN